MIRSANYFAIVIMKNFNVPTLIRKVVNLAQKALNMAQFTPVVYLCKRYVYDWDI